MILLCALLVTILSICVYIFGSDLLIYRDPYLARRVNQLEIRVKILENKL